uniref:Uncharacterized protein n=1 Tax=Oryza sativa subsp. japonica TaxID=39947 RepID=Q7XHU9_ORYSJ|nr:hypothetical protein [Oryza sativa Japonica Group]
MILKSYEPNKPDKVVGPGDTKLYIVVQNSVHACKQRVHALHLFVYVDQYCHAPYVCTAVQEEVVADEIGAVARRVRLWLATERQWDWGVRWLAHVQEAQRPAMEQGDQDERWHDGGRRDVPGQRNRVARIFSFDLGMQRKLEDDGLISRAKNQYVPHQIRWEDSC